MVKSHGDNVLFILVRYLASFWTLRMHIELSCDIKMVAPMARIGSDIISQTLPILHMCMYALPSFAYDHMTQIQLYDCIAGHIFQGHGRKTKHFPGDTLLSY